MKREGILILVVMYLSILFFMIFTKAGNSNLSYDEALKIGEEKYLKFLWMVDGAFNEERIGGEFIVNGKTLNKDKKIFTCKYSKKDNKTCVGNNFQEEFNNLFASNIKYDHVYSDKMTFYWYKYKDGKYYFTNPNNCNIKRMSLEQKITVQEILDNKVIYNIVYENDDYNRMNDLDFVLVNEENDWKISEAYYYDLCEMYYHIE